LTRWLLIPVLLLLSACSTLPPPAPPGDMTITGSAGDEWQLSGRVAIRQGQRADSASIDWAQLREHYRIELSGPFGQGGARIDGNAANVTLQIAGDDRRYHGDTPEAVMQQALGWYLPVSQAFYWVQGRPDPSYPHRPLAEAIGFHQLGWQIEVRRVVQLRPDLVLPALLELRYGDLRLRLLIRQWQLNDTHPPTIGN
jgi:outer membrane lipoprotein LolB